jgi:hypothetical protein
VASDETVLNLVQKSLPSPLWLSKAKDLDKYCGLIINWEKGFHLRKSFVFSVNIVAMPDNLFLSFVFFLTTYVQVNWCSSSRGSPTV